MRFAIWIAFMCCVVISSAQEQGCKWTVSGSVLDEHDNASLGYATIYVIELDKGVVADSMGYFILEDLCAGEYTIRFSHLGCETKERLVRVQGHTQLTLRLEHHAELLDAIELSARRIQEAGSAARTEVDRAIILQSTGLSLGALLGRLPGVDALQTGPNIFKPIIHGLHSNRILILRNGLRLESQQWGQDHAPEITAGSASKVSVIKGTAAVQYGADAVAGAILVESDELPETDSLKGDIQVTGIDNGRQLALSGSVEAGLGGGYGFRALAGGRRAGDARAAEYLLTNTGLSEWNLEIEAGRKKGLNRIHGSYRLFRSVHGILRSAHIGNITDLQEALQRDRPFIIEDFSYHIGNPRQHVLHHTIQMNAQQLVKRLGVMQGMYAVQWNAREEYDIRRGSRDEIPALDLSLQTHTGLLSLSQQHGDRFHGKTGLHWMWQQNRNEPGTGVRPLIPNYTRYIPAISWVERWISSKVEVDAGVRYEYANLTVKRINLQNDLEKHVFAFHNISISAGGRFSISENTRVYSHVGGTQRAPHVNELFSEGLHHGAAAIEQGDTTLASERAIKWDAGIEVRSRRWQLDATLFAQGIWDFIYLFPEGEPQLTIRGAFPVFRYVQDDICLGGADGTLQIFLTPRWKWQSELAMVRAWNLKQDEVLYGMSPDRMRHTISWEAGHPGASAKVSVEHAWKQKRVPEGIDYAPPPDAYTLIHAGAGVNLLNTSMHLHVTVRNLMNIPYREYLNRLRYYADDTGRSIELRLRYVF